MQERITRELTRNTIGHRFAARTIAFGSPADGGGREWRR